ncbi:MAG: hypothetical protein U0871_14700 [Gemmataceae bacterium]
MRWVTSDDTDTALPGEYLDFSFQAVPVVVGLTGAQIADPWYAFGGNAGGVAVPGAPITVDLNIAGLADAVENVAPGQKIHINDNFDEQQSTGIPLGGGPHTFASDNLVNPTTGKHVIVPGDQDLADGTLSLGPAGTLGTLTWTIGSNVKVWWQDAGNWVEVTNKTDFAAPDKAISLKIEGITLGGGSVKARFTIAGQSADDQVQYTIYTGLKVTGERSLRNQFLGQIGSSGAWKLTQDGDYNVWRTEGTVPSDAQPWQLTVRSYVDEIFKSETQTAVKAVVDKEVRFDRFATREVDPSDMARGFAFDTRWGAAVVTHALVEQYYQQVKGVTDIRDAHARACDAEAMVFVGQGTRTETITVTGTMAHWVFTYQGVVVEFDMDYTAPTNPSNFQKR